MAASKGQWKGRSASAAAWKKAEAFLGPGADADAAVGHGELGEEAVLGCLLRALTTPARRGKENRKSQPTNLLFPRAFFQNLSKFLTFLWFFCRTH